MRGMQCLLAPGLPDLAALGARDGRELLGLGVALAGEETAELVARDPSSRTLRIALPGTPDATGRRRGLPRGAGTGFVRLRRFQGVSLGRALAARFTRPCSSSLAAREWNLICHLRAQGVGTPEPLAMGPRDAPFFARRSFLVTRELKGAEPLPARIARKLEPSARRALARAFGLVLRRVFDAGVWIPRLSPSEVLVSEREDEACGAAEPAALAGLARSRLPAIFLVGFDGGRILPSIDVSRRLFWLERFAKELAPAQRPNPREALRVARLALGPASTREERRALRDGLRRPCPDDSSRGSRAPE